LNLINFANFKFDYATVIFRALSLSSTLNPTHPLTELNMPAEVRKLAAVSTEATF